VASTFQGLPEVMTGENSCWCGSSASKWDTPQMYMKYNLSHEDGGLHMPPHHQARLQCSLQTPCECCRKFGSACVANVGTASKKNAALQVLEGERHASPYVVPTDEDLRAGKYCPRYQNVNNSKSPVVASETEASMGEPSCYCGRPNSKWFPGTVRNKSALTHDDTGFDYPGLKACSHSSPCGQCTHMGDPCVRNVGDAATLSNNLQTELMRRRNSMYRVPLDSDIRAGRGAVNAPRGPTCWCGAPTVTWQPRVWQKSQLQFCSNDTTPCVQCQVDDLVCVEDSGTESLKNLALKDFVELATEATEDFNPPTPGYLVAQPVSFFNFGRWCPWCGTGRKQ